MMDGHCVEILSFESGQSLGRPMALVTLRPHSDFSEGLVAILFNQEQCLRLVDTLGGFLNDPESPLFMQWEKQLKCVVGDEYGTGENKNAGRR
jgi:hypothetical protein